MAARKDKQVHLFEDYTTLTSVKIFLGSNFEFYADYNGVRLTDKNMDNLLDKVQQAVNDSVNIEWVPVIQVTHLSPQTGYGMDKSVADGFIGFTLERFHVGHRNVDGKYVRAEWLTALEARRTRNNPFYVEGNAWPLLLPIHATNVLYGATTLIAYNEDLWQSLHALHTRIVAAKELLTALLGTSEGHAAILAQSVGNNLYIGAGLPAITE